MFRARIKPKYKRCSDHRGGEMKLNTVDSITDALREALTAYYKSNSQSKVMGRPATIWRDRSEVAVVES